MLRSIVAMLALFVVYITPVEARRSQHYDENYSGETASWYYESERTANCTKGKCERFNPEAITCAAAKSISFGTILRITEKETGKSVDCRVNDRGPRRSSHVDLSRGAARVLGILNRSTVQVTIAQLSTQQLPIVVAALTPIENDPPVVYNVPPFAPPLPTPERKRTDLLQEARRYLGTNPTGWASVWCARFMAFISPESERFLVARKLNPNWARDWAKLTKTEPQVGAIVVLKRGRKSGHIGVVSGFDKKGNPRVVSGNNRGRRVGESVYPKRRVLAYVSAVVD